jgi:hypothetical protein
MNPLYLKPVISLFANDNDALIPEIWANMGLAILEENMVAAALVHRDFSDDVGQFGDVVNTRRPGQFKIRRKGDNDPVLGQDAIVNNVQVPLDQHFYTNFTINDGEASKAFQDLVDIHLLPGMQNIARAIDRALLGRVHAYLVNNVGTLLGLTGTTAKATILAARQKLNENKAFFNGRHGVVDPASETSLLTEELFIAADKRGDDGTALREASLGRVLGIDWWLDQNTPSFPLASGDIESTTTTAVEPLGETNIAVTAAPTDGVGVWVVIAGEDKPHFVTATGGGPDITLDSGLAAGTASGAAVSYYNAVLAQGAYAAGENKAIIVDGFATGKPPQVGQLISVGAGASRRDYTVIESEVINATDQSILLDRPLELAIANDEELYPGPAGSYNFVFHREALALVSRPLALPSGDMGVRASVAVHNDVSMRIAMQYDISQQGTVVTLDLLAGVAVLDTDLGVVMLG